MVDYFEAVDTSSTELSSSFANQCFDSVVGTESSFHQLSPYIGKIKSSIAQFLIEHFSNEGDTIYDPFCGAGTIPFEAWIRGRNVIGNDLNEYAFLLTQAKLFPNVRVENVLNEIDALSDMVATRLDKVDLSAVPEWVSDFFHPETLKETIVWSGLLQERKESFLLACLLGILHHQRPGFLSYPSSHTVPYLRKNKFPSLEYPELYEYRGVKERLIKKVLRAYKRSPRFDFSLRRAVFNTDASQLIPTEKVDSIITSPPYMRQLTYARDNRLRLWFLGVDDHKALDEKISPKESDFIEIISSCFRQWDGILKPSGFCVLFLGDNFSKKYKKTLPEIIEWIVSEQFTNYQLVYKENSRIPTDRRVRRSYNGNQVETILSFKKLY